MHTCLVNGVSCITADGLSTVSLDLETERSKRARAQEAKERADADRLRLQRARDELAKNIMVHTFRLVFFQHPSQPVTLATD